MSGNFITVSQNLRNAFAEPRGSEEPTFKTKKDWWMGPRPGLPDGLGNNKPSRINQDYNHGVMYFRYCTLSSRTLCDTKAYRFLRVAICFIAFRFSNSSFSRGRGFRSVSRFRSLTVTSAVPHANFQY